MSRYVVGIDLGTTNSALAYADVGDSPDQVVPVTHLPIPQVVGVNDAADRPVLPSFLYLPATKEFPAGALGKGQCDLYISDLTEPNIRRLRNANQDPRTQTIEIIGQTGDLRGANGTMGFIGTKVFIAENRAASFMDTMICGPAGVINPATSVAYKNC